MSAIETHFIVMDYVKEWLLNSIDEDDERVFRHLLELITEDEKYLEV